MSGAWSLELVQGDTRRAFALGGEPDGEPRRGFAGMIECAGVAETRDGVDALIEVAVARKPAAFRLVAPDGRTWSGPYYLDTFASFPAPARDFELTLAAAGDVQETHAHD